MSSRETRRKNAARVGKSHLSARCSDNTIEIPAISLQSRVRVNGRFSFCYELWSKCERKTQSPSCEFRGNLLIRSEQASYVPCRSSLNAAGMKGVYISLKYNAIVSCEIALLPRQISVGRSKKSRAKIDYASTIPWYRYQELMSLYCYLAQTIASYQHFCYGVYLILH